MSNLPELEDTILLPTEKENLTFGDLFSFLSIDLGRRLTSDEKKVAVICWNKAQEVQMRTLRKKYKMVKKDE